ncbi:MAG: PBSX family phage terminase large subunit [Bacteroidetes bacterium]|nr:PBSX family phage terminase large subunit [Bacteroidota bacterium]
MSNEIIIEWPEWNKIINDRFVELIHNRDRYLILYGGRGSSKSDAMAKKLIYRCINEPYFRYLLIRNEYSTIKESSYQTIKDIIIDLGLDSLFTFNLNPLEITCFNGNRFIARGCDDTTKLKSVKDVTGAWYEEDIVSESDFITISTSIRTHKAEYLQEIFTVNPEVEGDYTQNWFWKMFFEGHDELSFNNNTSVQIEKNTTVEMKYTVHHSTYKDNRWITPQFIAAIMEMKRTNPYYYTIYCLGRWGNKITGGQFFRLFSIAKNVAPVEYNPSLPLWLSFDFNTMPGVSCGIFQVEGKVLRMIDEIQLASPRNNTTSVVNEVIRKFPNHNTGVNVTGDASGRHADTRTVAGFNDYTIIVQGLLKQYNYVRDRTPNLNPPVQVSANFVNSIFESGEVGYKGIKIIVGDNCKKMISDLLYLLEADDGTALKQKVKDKDTGATYERYGHFGDLFRYAVCTIFESDFHSAKKGGKSGFNITVGHNTQTSNTRGLIGDRTPGVSRWKF